MKKRSIIILAIAGVVAIIAAILAISYVSHVMKNTGTVVEPSSQRPVTYGYPLSELAEVPYAEGLTDGLFILSSCTDEQQDCESRENRAVFGDMSYEQAREYASDLAALGYDEVKLFKHPDTDDITEAFIVEASTGGEMVVQMVFDKLLGMNLNFLAKAKQPIAWSSEFFGGLPDPTENDILSTEGMRMSYSPSSVLGDGVPSIEIRQYGYQQSDLRGMVDYLSGPGFSDMSMHIYGLLTKTSDGVDPAVIDNNPQGIINFSSVGANGVRVEGSCQPTTITPSCAYTYIFDQPL